MFCIQHVPYFNNDYCIIRLLSIANNTFSDGSHRKTRDVNILIYITIWRVLWAIKVKDINDTSLITWSVTWSGYQTIHHSITLP